MKITQVTERVSVKYSFDVFNLFNTPSFDIPVDDVTQNIEFNDFPTDNQPPFFNPCDKSGVALYQCPSSSGLGNVNKTIGSSRQVQMTLSVRF